MAFSPLSGKNASVSVGTFSYAFDQFSIEMKDKLAEVSNFTGSGYRQFVSGLRDAKITCSGPYDEGNMGFSIGTSYSLTLTYTNGITATGTALLEDIKMDVKVDDAERVQLHFQSSGTFTVAII